MVLETTASIVGAIIAGGAGLTTIIGLIKWAIDRRDRLKLESVVKQKVRIPQMLKAFSSLYDLMGIPVERHGAARCLLLKASDSGNIPRIGIPLFVTVVAEVVGHGEYRLRDNWFERPVDDQYIQMLIDLTSHGETLVRSSELDLKDVLYDTYELTNTMQADLKLILQTNKEIYYLSVHFTESASDTPEYREELRQIVQNVKTLLQQELVATGELSYE